MSLLRRTRPALIVVSVLLLAALIIEHVNGRFWLNDLRVYYMAAQSMLEGSPVYGVAFGEDTGLYKYAPGVLWFFLPYTLFPFSVAALIHFLVMSVQVLAILLLIELHLCRTLFRKTLASPNLRAMLSVVFVAVLLMRELHLGNINLGLILLVLLGMTGSVSHRDAWGGIAFGIAWAVKPYLLLLAIPFLVRGRWTLLLSAAATISAFLVLPLLYPGPDAWSDLHHQWIRSMLGHSTILGSPDTVHQWLQVLAAGTLPGWSSVLPIVLAAGGLLWWALQNHRAGGDDEGLLSMELFTALALIPNLVVTDQEHFMYAWPLLGVALVGLSCRGPWWWWFVFGMAMFGYALRSSDLWGDALEARFTGWGLLGMGNILLITTANALYERHRRRHTGTPTTN